MQIHKRYRIVCSNKYQKPHPQTGFELKFEIEDLYLPSKQNTRNPFITRTSRVYFLLIKMHLTDLKAVFISRETTTSWVQILTAILFVAHVNYAVFCITVTISVTFPTERNAFFGRSTLHMELMALLWLFGYNEMGMRNLETGYI